MLICKNTTTNFSFGSIVGKVTNIKQTPDNAFQVSVKEPLGEREHMLLFTNHNAGFEKLVPYLKNRTIEARGHVDSDYNMRDCIIHIIP